MARTTRSRARRVDAEAADEVAQHEMDVDVARSVRFTSPSFSFSIHRTRNGRAEGWRPCAPEGAPRLRKHTLRAAPPTALPGARGAPARRVLPVEVAPLAGAPPRRSPARAQGRPALPRGPLARDAPARGGLLVEVAPSLRERPAQGALPGSALRRICGVA
jgi:hypothetical protein